MTFNDVIYHDQQKQLLQQALRNQRLAHAYLFAGQSGVGKRLTAMALSRALCCDNGSGCGECPACRKIDHLNHPDLFLIDPDERQIKIEIIRELQKSLSLRPLEGQYRICLIDEAQRLNLSAANALLKTIEEPPPNTLVILISSEADSLPSTIRSRCQRLNFGPIPRQLMADTLQQRTGLDEKQAMVVAALTNGSFEKAFSTQEEFYFQKRTRLYNSLLSISSGAILPLFNLAKKIADEKEEIEETLNLMRFLYRDLLLLIHGRPESELVNIDSLELLHRQLSRETPGGIIRKLGSIEKTRNYLRRNVNPQLAIENLLLETCTSTSAQSFRI